MHTEIFWIASYVITKRRVPKVPHIKSVQVLISRQFFYRSKSSKILGNFSSLCFSSNYICQKYNSNHKGLAGPIESKCNNYNEDILPTNRRNAPHLSGFDQQWLAGCRTTNHEEVKLVGLWSHTHPIAFFQASQQLPGKKPLTITIMLKIPLNGLIASKASKFYIIGIDNLISRLGVLLVTVYILLLLL